MPTPPTPMTSTITALAGRPGGVRDGDHGLTNFNHQAVRNALCRMVLRGKLIAVRVGHQHTRYFANAAHATQFAETLRQPPKKDGFGTMNTAWRGGRAAPGPGVVTEKTVFTKGPDYVPRFQALDTFHPMLRGHR